MFGGRYFRRQGGGGGGVGIFGCSLFRSLLKPQSFDVTLGRSLLSPRPVAMWHGKVHVVTRMFDPNCLVSAESVAELDVAIQKPKLINSYYSFSVENCLNVEMKNHFSSK